MILFTWGREPETRVWRDGSLPYCSEFRKGLELHFDRTWWALEIIFQYRVRETGKWSTNHSPNYAVGFDWRKFHWLPNVSHDYYDGPHCSFSFGWFRLLWSGFPWTGHWCKKCMPDD